METSTKRLTQADFAGLDQIKKAAESLGNRLFGKDTAIRGGLGYEEIGGWKGFSGPNFMLVPKGNERFQVNMFQMKTLEMDAHEDLTVDGAIELLEQAREWHKKHPPRTE